MMTRLPLASLATALVIGAFAACQTPAATCPEPIVIVSSDAAAPLDDPSRAIGPPDIIYDEPFDAADKYTVPACAAACANLEAHGCGEAVRRAGEDSCYVTCKRAEATGGRINFKPQCIAAAKDRTAIRACGTYRCT